MLARYSPSGRCSMMILPCAAALIALAAGAGWLYQWGHDHIGVRRVPYLLVAGLAGVLSLGAWSAVLVARCRSPWIGIAVGLLASLSAILTSHAVKYQRAVASGAPTAVVEHLRWRASQGIGGRPGSTGRPGRQPQYTGAAAHALWWLEAAVMGAAGSLGGLWGARRPFCESCGRYAGREHWKLRVERPSEDAVKGVRRATSAASLREQEWVETGKEGSSLEYSVKVCPRCAGVPTLTVTHHTKDGNAWWLGWVLGWFWTSDGSSDLHSGVLLNDEELDALTEWAAAKPGFESEALGNDLPTKSEGQAGRL